YELDSIVLADAVEQNRIQPLSNKLPIRPDDYLKNAQTANLNGTWYGIPHWVCGYFLFFKADDPQANALRNLRKLSDLEGVVGTNHSKGSGLTHSASCWYSA